MLRTKFRYAPLAAAVLAAWAVAAQAQTASAKPGATSPGRLDELGCRYVRAAYSCERAPLAGRSFTSKQEALKALQRQRTAPKPRTATPTEKAPKAPATATPKLTPSSPAAGKAASWAPVADGDGAQYFIDMNNLSAQGRTITARTLTRYTAPRNSTSVAQPYRSTVSVEKYDCANRTYAMTEMRYHAEGDGAGKALQTVDVPDDKLTYLAPLPGTVNERLMNQVCSPRR